MFLDREITNKSSEEIKDWIMQQFNDWDIQANSPLVGGMEGAMIWDKVCGEGRKAVERELTSLINDEHFLKRDINGYLVLTQRGYDYIRYAK
jgi:hypothetical protein